MTYIAAILYRKWRGQKTRLPHSKKVGGMLLPPKFVLMLSVTYVYFPWDEARCD